MARDEGAAGSRSTRSPTCRSSSCATRRTSARCRSGWASSRPTPSRSSWRRSPRRGPMTHDLIKNILETLDARVAEGRGHRSHGEHLLRGLHLQLGSAEYHGRLAAVGRHRARAAGGRADLRGRGRRPARPASVEVAKEPRRAGKADDPEQIKEWLETIKPEDFEISAARTRAPGRVVDAGRALHQQLPAVLRRGHDRRRDAAAGARGARPRGLDLRARACPAPPADPPARLPLPVDSRRRPIRSSRCRCPCSPRLGRRRPRARPRRLPRPPSVPARPRPARRLARRLRRPLVFTYHTRYEKYAHYVPLPRAAGAGPSRCAWPAASPTRADAGRRALRARGATRCGARGVRTPIAVVPTGVDLDLLPPGDRERRAARARAARGRADLSLRRPARPREERGAGARRLRAHRRHAVRRHAAPGRAGHPRAEALARGRPRAGRRRPRSTSSAACAREALPACYQAADLFLFASETETQGLVLAEAARLRPARGGGARLGRGRGRARRRDRDPHQGGDRRAGRRRHRTAARRRAARGDGPGGATARASARFAAPGQTAAMVAHYEALLARRP